MPSRLADPRENQRGRPPAPHADLVPSVAITRMRRFGLIHVTGIPEGLEILVVSKLSAALAGLIGQHEAVVELNYYIPLAGRRARRRNSPFSPEAARLVDRLSRYFAKSTPAEWYMGAAGLLDTGLRARPRRR